MTSLRRIVMVASVLPHHCIGGMQAVAWDLARGLAKAGIAVTILTAEIPRRPTTFEEDGVTIRALARTSWRHYGPGWWKATRRAFADEFLDQCDLLLSVSAGGFGLLGMRERIPHVPFVMQAHGTSMGEVVSKWRSHSLKAMATSARNVAWILKDLAAYPRFDAIVAVGDRVARDLFAWPASCVLDGRHVHVIRNGIDTATFRPNADAGRRIRNQLGWDDRLGVIISASRLHRQKGVAYGLEGFALLTKGRTDLRYLIVGDGPELGALKDKAVSLGIDSYVHFTGGVARTEIPALLNAANVMLFTTTRIEGEPMNVLEALASGLPAVVSRHLYRTGSPSDQIFPVKPNSPSEVATALRQALALPSSGESKLPTEYSANSCIAQYSALFHNLVAQRA